ncbi:MAG: hypothetical protein K2Q10_01725 [Rhodospirillales bacterium]|nr:hypothetical protein [Rhodospirillales bacterium]
MRKEAIIGIRVPAEVKAAWQQAAGGNRRLSDWIRESAEARRLGHVAPLRAELLALRTEVNRLGSNVNQAIHLAHRGEPLDAAAIEAAYADMREMVRRALS